MIRNFLPVSLVLGAALLFQPNAHADVIGTGYSDFTAGLSSYSSSAAASTSTVDKLDTSATLLDAKEFSDDNSASSDNRVMGWMWSFGWRDWRHTGDPGIGNGGTVSTGDPGPTGTAAAPEPGALILLIAGIGSLLGFAAIVRPGGKTRTT